jgi:hypothetical protein
MIFDPLNEIHSHIRVAFIVSDENSLIDFEITSPSQKRIFQALEKSHLYYSFNVTEPGEYIFSLDNRNNDQSTRVTFAIHQGNSTDTHLSHEQLNQIWEKIKIVNKQAKKSIFTAKLLSKKSDAHYDHVKSHNRKIVFLSIFETAIMSLIFFFQLCYIRSLANKIIL